jgi:putative transposase
LPARATTIFLLKEKLFLWIVFFLISCGWDVTVWTSFTLVFFAGRNPLSSSLSLGTLADLGRSRSQLITENALLRKPLIILRRQVKRPTYRKADRFLLLLLARVVRNWKQALLIMQPDTLLRWHRELFRLVWKRKSKAASHARKIPAETVALRRRNGGEKSMVGS